MYEDMLLKALKILGKNNQHTKTVGNHLLKKSDQK